MDLKGATMEVGKEKSAENDKATNQSDTLEDLVFNDGHVDATKGGLAPGGHVRAFDGRTGNLIY